MASATSRTWPLLAGDEAECSGPPLMPAAVFALSMLVVIALAAAPQFRRLAFAGLVDRRWPGLLAVPAFAALLPLVAGIRLTTLTARVADCRRSIPFTEFEHRQIAAVRKDLDAECEFAGTTCHPSPSARSANRHFEEFSA